MDEELRAFLHASAERKMQSGMSATEAQRAARVEMGSLESVKDQIRGAGWETAAEAVWTDVRYSVRVLAKAPVFERSGAHACTRDRCEHRFFQPD